MRRHTVQSKNVKASMSSKTSEVFYHNSIMSKEAIVGESFLGANINGNGQRSLQSTMDVHSTIIEESIQAAVRHRMQQELQGQQPK
jgi:hypothetical protein